MILADFDTPWNHEADPDLADQKETDLNGSGSETLQIRKKEENVD